MQIHGNNIYKQKIHLLIAVKVQDKLQKYVVPFYACGDCGGTTKERYLEILEFTHFVEFFSFNKIGENHKEKILVQRVTVVVALDLGTGNTKNLEYENE